MYYFILSLIYLLNLFLFSDLIDCAIVQTPSSYTCIMLTATTRPHCVQSFYLESSPPTVAALNFLICKSDHVPSQFKILQ